jgi:hypothetical protein
MGTPTNLHCGELRATLVFCLAITNQALKQKCATSRKTITENPKYTFRTWLIRLGLNGDEFKNVRKHLLSRLDGNIAWLHPEDALKQRERLKAERKLEHESAQTEAHTDCVQSQNATETPIVTTEPENGLTMSQ